MVKKARKDAWTAKYQSYSGRRLSPEGYKKWREKNIPAPVSKPQASGEPVESAERQAVGAPNPKKGVGTPAGQVAFRGVTPTPSGEDETTEEEETTSPSVKTTGDRPEGPAEILTLKNHSLWNTAGRKDVYGDPELYPLLLDANRKVLKADQMTLKAGTRLTVPRGVSEEKIKRARRNAWTNDYMRYRGIGMTKSAYTKWRKSKAK
jgi:hypothetical protein